jgi:hypothetical protein
MTADLGTLLRQEVELAKVETKEEVSRAGKAGAIVRRGRHRRVHGPVVLVVSPWPGCLTR